MLDSAHEGYEYQDYFTVAIALDLMLHRSDARLVIDRKDFKTDKFDDLKVVSGQKKQPSICYQIKYSNKETDHVLEKADFSYGNGHGTCITDLFDSWRKLRESGNFSRLILCLAWRKPSDGDALDRYLIEEQKSFLPFDCRTYHFDGRKFWLKNKSIPENWRKVKTYLSDNNIDRDEFIEFCDDLAIEVELPKSSLDYDQPSELEQHIKSAVARLGVGVYPNDAIRDIDVINRIAIIVKTSRARGGTIDIRSLAESIGLITDYGRLDQNFPVDKNVQILLRDELDALCSFLNEKKRVIVSGNPGSGKSWLVEEFVQFLKDNDKNVIRYSCFISPEDNAAVKRVQYNSLYGNLIYQLIEQNPELENEKETLWGADKKELERLLRLANNDIYVIVDGLDHIDREYELNKNVLSKNETAIIKELIEIQFPDNCYVLIISQPINELDAFRKKGYSDFEIRRWNKEQIVDLMNRYQINDIVLESSTLMSSEMMPNPDITLSTIFLNKSQGNVLYLSYLMRQFQGQIITEELLKDLPDYDVSLSNYYKYLYSQVTCSQTVFALCGAEFYLNENDLQEITGLGNFVKEDLSALHPVLQSNSVSGGFAIYHESFRRFVLNKLKDEKVNVSKTVYEGLIDWLKSKPFYKNQKSYYYLPSLYLKANDDNIVDLIKTDFVIESIREGYARQKIRSNIVRMIYGAAKATDLVALATAAELLSMLDDLNDVEDTRESYIEGVANIKGADKLKNLMQVDGKATMSVSAGLKACYICSRAGVHPWWDLYIDADKESIIIHEEAKYYFRYYIDRDGLDAIPQVMKDIESGNNRSALIKEIYPEIVNYIGEENIQDICKENELTHWEKYIRDFKAGFSKPDMFSEKAALELFDHILGIEYPSEENILTIESFFNAEYALARYDRFDDKEAFFSSIIKKCKNINWFHNWLIYYVEIVDLWAECEKSVSCDLDNEVLDAFENLISDTEVFKGKPRTCDLYSISGILDKSFTIGLKTLKSKKSLKVALDILSETSEKTATWLDASRNGPLTNEHFMKVLSNIINSENSDIIIPYLENCVKETADGEAYDYTVDAAFRTASILHIYHPKEAERYYNLGVSYLVGYGYHKDTIIEQIIDSYQSYANAKRKASSDIDSLKKYRDSITAMTRALFAHTDGRTTNHYLNIWIDVLLKTEPLYAVGYISGYQLKQRGGWITDTMIRSLIRKYCDNLEYSQLIVGLIKSLPNDMSYSLIDAAATLLEKLLKKGDSETLDGLIKEIVVNILSRYNILDDHTLSQDGSSDREAIERFISIAAKTNIDIEQYKSFFDTHASRENDNHVNIQKKGSVFDVIYYDDAIAWFGNNDLTEENKPQVVKYLKSLRNEQQLYDCFKIIILRRKWDNGEAFHDLIVAILDTISVSENFTTRVLTLLFLNSSEWGNSLVDSTSFLEAYEKNEDTTLFTLFDELPAIIEQRSGRIVAGLINALGKVNGYDDVIVRIWENVLKIIQLRFPNLNSYNYDIAEEFDDEQSGLIAVLTGRMIDGGKEQFLSAYNYITDQIVDEALFLSAISYGIKHFNEWNYVTKLAFALFIQDYSTSLHGERKVKLIEEIDSIYPTGNLLIDQLLSEGTIYTETLKSKTDKHIPDIYEKNDIEFYLNEQLPDLGRIDKSKFSTDDGFYVKNCYYRDSAMWLLKCTGIDYESLYTNLHASELINRKIKDFVDASTRQPEMNTEYKSYVLLFAQHLILEKAYKEKQPLLIQQTLPLLLSDFYGMYLYAKCRELAPENHIFDKSSENSELINTESENDYRQVAALEVKRDIDYKKNNMTIAYGGLVTDSWIDEHKDESRPLNDSYVFSFFADSIIELALNRNCLIDASEKLDKEFEGEAYLWPSRILCKKYGLQKMFDKKTRSFCAVDSGGRTVFWMKNWTTCYKGNSDYSGYAIPLFYGVELIARIDFLKILEADYGKLHFATKVYSFNLN